MNSVHNHWVQWIGKKGVCLPLTHIVTLRGNMTKVLLFALLFLSVFVRPSGALELKEIKSSDELARFIYHMASDNVPVNKLLKGLESSDTLRISDYEVAIPVREVFGTIVIERFGEKLGRLVFESDKKYDVREICAFRDSKDQVWRFHIIILEERQCNIIRSFLEELMKDERVK